MTEISLAHYLTLGGILFALSVVGIFLNRRNLIVLLMAIELMLLAVNMNFVAFSHYLPIAQDRMAGQVFVFFILTVAAAESAIGLAILVVLFRNRATIAADELDALKG
jgi:NADH-quinone oxidoreductase subunit K